MTTLRQRLRTVKGWREKVKVDIDATKFNYQEMVAQAIKYPDSFYLPCKKPEPKKDVHMIRFGPPIW